MPKFRKKPVEVEAFQLLTDDSEAADLRVAEIMGWMSAYGHHGTQILGPRPFDILIETLEGTMRATAGDWIIRGVHGEFYPCKPDIFEATYEPAEVNV